jgi:hypothetical protein
MSDEGWAVWKVNKLGTYGKIVFCRESPQELLFQDDMTETPGF